MVKNREGWGGIVFGGVLSGCILGVGELLLTKENLMLIKEMLFATAHRIDWLFSDPIYWSPVLFIVAVMALLFSEAMRD